MNKHLLRFSSAVIALAFCAFTVCAQKGTFAITNAEIITVSGAVIPSGTVVVRDGLIESVGAGAKVPSDAKVLDGKGLTIYPGFFDTNTSLGVPPPQPRPGNAKDESNSNYPASLRPETDITDSLKAGEAQFSAYRNSGITTVLTGSSDGIFNGHSAVINLAGDTVSAMIVRSNVAQNIAFNTERGGVFPASLLGTFAAMRQMFNDAKRLDEIQRAYASNPKGMKRPEADPSLEALIPVLKGEIPVIMFADSEREIIRALDFTSEYKLKTLIAGGQEAGRVASRLKAQNVPVLLTLNFPVRTSAENKDADEESMRTLRSRVEVPKNAGMLKAAGVKFAFQSGGLKNIRDYLKNAGEATKNGLSEIDAIRAMTLSAAELLGVDAQLGSVEAGKIANLVVVKGPLFDKDMTVTHVFVDGKLFEQPKKVDKPAGPANPNAKAVAAGGTWNVTIEAPGITVPMTLNLTQSGSTITGSIGSSMLGNADIRSGKVTENGFTFESSVVFQGTNLELVFNGRIDGNNVEGTVDTAQGPATFSGTRTPGRN